MTSAVGDGLPVLSAGLLWAGLVAWLLSRAVRQFRAFEPIEPAPPGWAGPALAVVVPVRNEAQNIEPCLSALTAQTYPAGRLSIVVVDDESSDATAEAVLRMAARDGRIRLVSGLALPAGWAGKPHACWQGALAADAPWLCFLDADVRARPGLLAAAVATAQARDLGMLSLHPRQELRSFWERLVVPVGLLLIACASSLRRVNDPELPDAEANGQFILIRREAYLTIGGHAAVRAEICEDKALARLAKRSGVRLQVLAAEAFASTRLYADLRALWQGYSKNATEILGGVAATLLVTAAGLGIGWGTIAVPMLAGLAAAEHHGLAVLAGFGLSLVASFTVLAVQIGTAQRLRIPWLFGLLLPLGYAFVAALVLNAVWARAQGRVAWKGRLYGGRGGSLRHAP